MAIYSVKDPFKEMAEILKDGLPEWCKRELKIIAELKAKRLAESKKDKQNGRSELERVQATIVDE